MGAPRSCRRRYKRLHTPRTKRFTREPPPHPPTATQSIQSPRTKSGLRHLDLEQQQNTPIWQPSPQSEPQGHLKRTKIAAVASPASPSPVLPKKLNIAPPPPPRLRSLPLRPPLAVPPTPSGASLDPGLHDIISYFFQMVARFLKNTSPPMSAVYVRSVNK